ncbi:MAG: sugar phosphate nucleotidyltransferase, partial [Selenomonas noxia]
MHIVLLSGGSGKRLWPLSNDIRSKQFIPLFRQNDGTRQSMAQRVCGQVGHAIPDAEITIATSKAQVSALRSQLGDMVDICVEPCRRDTFPAIALVSAYLHDVKGVALDEAVAVCPVDPYVEDAYFASVRYLAQLAAEGMADLMLMGIEPSYPSEKYGYIMPKDKENVSRVLSFREKPDEAAAKEYIEQGALWNSGVFAYCLGYVLERSQVLLGCSDYETLLSTYD